MLIDRITNGTGETGGLTDTRRHADTQTCRHTYTHAHAGILYMQACTLWEMPFGLLRNTEMLCSIHKSWTYPVAKLNKYQIGPSNYCNLVALGKIKGFIELGIMISVCHGLK